MEYDSGPGSHTWCQLISVGQWSVVSPHHLIPAQAQTSSHHLSLVTDVYIVWTRTASAVLELDIVPSAVSGDVVTHQ